MSYPEHEKLDAVKEQSQAIGEFLDLGPYTLCEWVKFDDCDREQLVPVRKPLQAILADWFKIDLAKLEGERRAMLEAMTR
jgi:hypothetical protein